LTPEQKQYLLSRGYTNQYLKKEKVFGVGSQLVYVLDRPIMDCEGCVAWLAVSMSGTPIGVQTRELKEKKYRWHQFDNVEHLPMLYGSEEDWDLLFSVGSMVLTEGPFDRIAVKRALPNRAVFARLSKGTSNQMIFLIKRYINHLWLAFDADEEGEKAATRSEELLGEDVNIYRLKFPYHDPSEMLKKRGLETLRSHLERQIGVQSFE